MYLYYIKSKYTVVCGCNVTMRKRSGFMNPVGGRCSLFGNSWSLPEGGSLNREIICSGSTACSTCFAESSLVLQQRPTWNSVLELNAHHVSALWTVAVGVWTQVNSFLNLSVFATLPFGWIAIHLEKVYLFYSSGHLVLLCDHVLRVLLGGQLVVGEGEWEEVRGAGHTLIEIWRWGWWSRWRYGDLSDHGGVRRSDSLCGEANLPAMKILKELVFINENSAFF